MKRVAVLSFTILCVTTARGITQDEDGSPSRGRSPFSGGDAHAVVHEGAVILAGRYLPGPYEIQEKDGQLRLNETAIPTPSLWGSQSGRRRGFRNLDRFNTTRMVTQRLRNGGMLLILDEASYLFNYDEARSVLTILVSDQDRRQRMESLHSLHAAHESQSSIDWDHVVDLVESHDLARAPILAQYAIGFGGVHDAEHHRATALLSIPSFGYSVTVGGMVLAVVAFGLLLHHRPHARGAWTEVDQDSDGFVMLPRFVVLVVVFALLDLTFTLAASQSVGFRELNPLAGSLIGAPVAMIAFKVAATGASAAILISLRRYRGAQLASWWLCLISTVLMFRWLTVNSLFLA